MRVLRRLAPGGGGGPDVVALHADAVDHVVAQAGIELREGVDAAAEMRLRPPMVAGPDVAGALVEREREHGAMRQASPSRPVGRKIFHLPFS